MGGVVTGKSVLVTGAASGIGKACVSYLLAGDNHVTAMDLDESALKRAFQTSPAGRLKLIAGDVSQANDCAEAVDAAAKAFGKLDALMNWAGVHSTMTWEEVTGEHLQRILAVNTVGSFLIAQAAARRMKATGGGAIMLTSSTSIIHAPTGGPAGNGGPAYVTSKAAIVGLVRTLARALGPHNIRVNGIVPGVTDTPMIGNYSEETRQLQRERSPLGRIGTPEELAEAGCLLISDASRYVSGEMLIVNGGTIFG